LDGSGELRDTTVYTYGNQHEQAIHTARKNSRGDSLISETRFVRDLITSETGSFMGDAYPLLLMKRRNMNTPVEQLTFIKKSRTKRSPEKSHCGKLYPFFGYWQRHQSAQTHYSIQPQST
jgi:hypothetical protein